VTPTRLTGPLPGPAVLDLGSVDLSAAGYVHEEWFIEGRAQAYRMPGRPTADGRWSVTPGTQAAYRTRLVVVRPADRAGFDGTVVLEWLNVSGGHDVPTDWLYVHRHLVRTGAAWIGVTAQAAGISGGGLMAGQHLQLAAPQRYGRLRHPGDAYAYDIYSQAAAAARGGRLTGGRQPLTVLGVGESQSAIFLTTYVNAVDPQARVVDGFLLHGRGARGAWVDGVLWQPGRLLTESIGRRPSLAGHRIRDDVRVPVITVQSETDLVLMGSGFARQPDGERFRLWEVAGAAHFDTYGLRAGRVDDGRLSPEELHETLRPMTDPRGLRTSAPTNSGPQQHYVLQAALDGLRRWAAGGAPPSPAPRLATRPLLPVALVRDATGTAVGGVRTPWVEAPTAVLSGLGQRVRGFGMLFGTTRPLEPRLLVQRYPGGRQDHEAQFRAATRRAVAAGHLLAEDADEVLALGRCAWADVADSWAAGGRTPAA
jgi:hypothetical protein